VGNLEVGNDLGNVIVAQQRLHLTGLSSAEIEVAALAQVVLGSKLNGKPVWRLKPKPFDTGKQCPMLPERVIAIGIHHDNCSEESHFSTVL
jgi:hypothetical protein